MNQIKTYSYPEAQSIVVCGDIHGEFNTLIYKMCIQYGMTDTLLIVAGDCGFGFEKQGYYENVFRHNSARLTKANNWIAMVRGNHDDPAYFDEERISHRRFRTIPDYSIVQACGHNILCVGGAVSIDRSFRKEHDSRNHSLSRHFSRLSIAQASLALRSAYRKGSSGTASYWPDEMPVFDEPKLSEIDRQFKIDSVITHTAPSFCELLSKAGLSGWAERDAELLTDCEKERETMDRLFEHLKAAGHLLSHWYYGHFHQSWNSGIDDILFSMLDIMEFKELR